MVHAYQYIGPNGSQMIATKHNEKELSWLLNKFPSTLRGEVLIPLVDEDQRIEIGASATTLFGALMKLIAEVQTSEAVAIVDFKAQIFPGEGAKVSGVPAFTREGWATEQLAERQYIQAQHTRRQAKMQVYNNTILPDIQDILRE